MDRLYGQRENATQKEITPKMHYEQSRIDLLCRGLSNDEDTVDEIKAFKRRMEFYNVYDLAVHHATDLRLTKILTLLLSKYGFNVNKRNNNDITPLHIACFNGDFNSVEILLKHGSDMYSKDFRGSLPSFILLENMGKSRISVAEVVNDRNSKRKVEEGQETIFKILQLMFQHGYEIDSTNYFGRLEVHNFVKFGPKEIIGLFIQFGYDYDMLMLIGNDVSLLHSAVMYDNKNVAQELLNYIDINYRGDITSSTALHVAADCGSIACTELLLEHGAEVDMMSINNKTPLQYAISSLHENSVHVVERLLQWKSAISADILSIINVPCRDMSYLNMSMLEIKRKSLYKHTFKRMVAGINVDNWWCMSSVKNDYFSYIDDINHAEFVKQHENEIQRMKHLMLGPNLSAYDVIIRDINYFDRHLNNILVKQFYEMKSYLLTEFPLYADYLETSYKMARIKKSLIR